MRPRLVIVAVLSICVVGAVTLGVALRRPPSREAVLADGSVIRAESVTFGLRQPFKTGGWFQRLKEQAAPHLPKSWTKDWIKPPLRSFGNWWMNTASHTNSNALQVWITRRNPATEIFQNVEVHYADLVDEHGCVLEATQIGGTNAGLAPPVAPAPGPRFGGPSSDATWLSFEAFPRQEGRFTMRLYDTQRKFLGQMTLANPAPAMAPAKWQTAPLPIATTNAGVTFILKSLALKTNYDGRATNRVRAYRNAVEIRPKFEVWEHGQLSKDWEVLDIELWDDSGNFAAKWEPQSLFLCPHDAAWKLVARFCGSENAPAASNAVSVMRGVKIPRTGEFTDMKHMQTSASIQGLSFNLVAIAGVGNVVYSNDVPVSSSRGSLLSALGLGPKDVIVYTGNNQTFYGTKPHIAVTCPTLRDDQWLSIRAVDNQGRECYARESNAGDKPNWSDVPATMSFIAPRYGGSRVYYLSLDLPADAETVDLHFCLHSPRTVEFIFKPPQPARR